MSTNFFPEEMPAGLPDQQALERLANLIFAGHEVPQGAVAEGIPGSVAGSGISPSAVNQGNGVDINDPQTSLPDPHFAGKGLVPASVAGSGRSPSFGGGGVPGYLPAGSGWSGGPRALPASGVGGEHSGGFPASGVGGEHSGGFARGLPGEFGGGPRVLPGAGLSGGVPSGFGGGLPGALAAGLPGASAAGLPGALAGGLPGGLASGFPGSLGGGLPGALAAGLPTADSTGYYFVDERGLPAAPFDVNQVRRDFPILQQYVNGHPLVWLDNAATTQKPQAVIDRISHFYRHENSNIHRAAHELAARSTDAYEGAREKARKFLNAGSVNEIVYVRGATEAINLVAKSWGRQFLRPGDEIIVTHLEHHANIVPWQQLAKELGLALRVVPVDEDGQVLLDAYGGLLGPKTRLVSFTQVSNALGTITPAKKIVEMAHAVGAKVLVDGAQAVSHMPVDVRALDADWYVFSGHKVFGPTGIGVLYGKEALLNETGPWQGGGNMIRDVTFEHTVYQDAPARFEAGTGNIADAIGLGAALDYVMAIGMDVISHYEHQLLGYATRLLQDISGLRIIGTAPDKAGVLSLVLEGYRPEEVGAALNASGIAVRSGHHCAQPILRRFGQEATVRPSLALYNTCSDIDALVSVLRRLRGARPRR